MAAARLVVMEIRRGRPGGELVRQQPQQSNDIGLFDHLGFLRAFSSQYHVHGARNGPRSPPNRCLRVRNNRRTARTARFADQGRSPWSPRHSATASVRLVQPEAAGEVFQHAGQRSRSKATTSSPRRTFQRAMTLV